MIDNISNSENSSDDDSSEKKSIFNIYDKDLIHNNLDTIIELDEENQSSLNDYYESFYK